jgi:hypothetical protein
MGNVEYGKTIYAVEVLVPVAVIENYWIYPQFGVGM